MGRPFLKNVSALMPDAPGEHAWAAAELAIMIWKGTWQFAGPRVLSAHHDDMQNSLMRLQRHCRRCSKP